MSPNPTRVTPRGISLGPSGSSFMRLTPCTPNPPVSPLGSPLRAPLGHHTHVSPPPRAPRPTCVPTGHLPVPPNPLGPPHGHLPEPLQATPPGCHPPGAPPHTPSPTRVTPSTRCLPPPPPRSPPQTSTCHPRGAPLCPQCPPSPSLPPPPRVPRAPPRSLPPHAGEGTRSPRSRWAGSQPGKDGTIPAGPPAPGLPGGDTGTRLCRPQHPAPEGTAPGGRFQRLPRLIRMEKRLPGSPGEILGWILN